LIERAYAPVLPLDSELPWLVLKTKPKSEPQEASKNQPRYKQNDYPKTCRRQKQHHQRRRVEKSKVWA
jgi:hypothetical protein